MSSEPPLMRVLKRPLQVSHGAGWALFTCCVLSLALAVCAAWLGALALRPGSVTAEGALPGRVIWRGGVSSFLFGANDTYEYAANNFETQPLIQQQVKRAGISVIRTFIKDPSTNAEIEQRVAAIERSGAHCLVVLTDIHDRAFNERLVRYLGSRCLLYEFGNEPDYTGVSVDDYAAAWNATVPALRAINPRARFYGPVESQSGPYLSAFLALVKLSGVLPDAVTLHWYPCYNDTQAACLAKAGGIYDAVIAARAATRLILGKELPIGVTEWNFDPEAPPPIYGDDANFINQFTTTAISAMIRAGVSLACQYDIASFAGYGGLDMIDIFTNQPKPQFTTMARLISEYKRP